MMLPRHRLIRAVHARPRLLVAVLLASAVGLLLPDAVAAQPVTRWLIAWNAGTALYVALAAVMMARSSADRMRWRAQLQDEQAWVLLVLVAVATVASLVAIAAELAVVKDLHGWQRQSHVALAVGTALTGWAFTQVMFALHYAHDYYAAEARGRSPVLLFPGDEPPDYFDFVYFAVVIGTSGQTADVSFAGRSIRRIGTLHCVLAYLFNTTVLAMLVNVAAGLF